jgi:hypothetical protein
MFPPQGPLAPPQPPPANTTQKDIPKEFGNTMEVVSSTVTTVTAVAAVVGPLAPVTNSMQSLNKIASKGSGPVLLFMLDQMQSVASSGTMAPADMPGFQAVTGSMGWTTQLPVPFWDAASESPLTSLCTTGGTLLHSYHGCFMHVACGPTICNLMHDARY